MLHQFKRVMRTPSNTRHSRKCRRGFLMTELIVAATLLIAVMSVVTPLAVRSGRLWQDSRHYRLAIEELSNQLERLTALNARQRKIAVQKLALSPEISTVLPNPVLSAETLADEDGIRLVLHLSWDRLGKNNPVAMVAWIDSSAVSAPADNGGTAP